MESGKGCVATWRGGYAKKNSFPSRHVFLNVFRREVNDIENKNDLVHCRRFRGMVCQKKLAC